jgi:hypothetical protein
MIWGYHIRLSEYQIRIHDIMISGYHDIRILGYQDIGISGYQIRISYQFIRISNEGHDIRISGDFWKSKLQEIKIMG